MKYKYILKITEIQLAFNFILPSVKKILLLLLNLNKHYGIPVFN